ncbi:hypothetical protein ANN_13453 [Periplaneta americana]|uniref:Uncharacterized protein n=1 Tax=Periplaneta americana TaxID=6978 RepID=A0ABQ8TJF7_PERAM|nr:hypothetical protein ANN_13453 [Periplaneta americana]
MVMKLGLSWTLTLREGNRLRVFENKVLRKIFGAKRDEVTGEWRKLHNTELRALYSSPDIIRNIKSRRLRWAGHVARMGESRNAYRVSEGGKNQINFTQASRPDRESNPELLGSKLDSLTPQPQRSHQLETRNFSPAAEYTKWDHKRNEDVMEELQLEPVINLVKHYRNNWINHLHRMHRDRIPKVMLHYRPNGKRSLGRPKKRRIENSTVRS